MLTEGQERHLRRTLKTAQSAPSPELEARARAAMAEPTRARRARHRLVVVSAVAALALLGFGLTRLPVSSASGLFGGFLAAASQAKTLHLQATIDDDGIVVIEKWEASEERFWRRDRWEAGELTSLGMSDGEFTARYRIDSETGRGETTERYDVLTQGAVLHGWPEPAPALGPLRLLAEPIDSGELELIYEGRETNDLGEAVDVVEAEWRPEGTHVMYYHLGDEGGTGLRYEEGERVLIRVEVDPASSLPRAMTHSVEQDGARRSTFEAEFEWNAEIPEAARTFTPPAGSTVEHDYWWERRFPEVVAEAETRDWVVTLHAIDSDRHGWIHLSLSRHESGENRITNSGPPILVEAVGSGGERYDQDSNFGPFFGGPGCAYAVVRLIPVAETPQPDSITLTVTPYAGSPSQGQTLTFENLPLPPRQPVDDLRAEETDVIQY
jgi:hypothetical protein